MAARLWAWGIRCPNLLSCTQPCTNHPPSGPRRLGEAFTQPTPTRCLVERRRKRSKENFGQHLLRCGGSLRSWEIRHPVRSLATTGMCLRTNGDSWGPGTAAARWGWKLGQRGATRVLRRQPWHALRCTGPPRRWSHHAQGLAHIGPAMPRAGTGFAPAPHHRSRGAPVELWLWAGQPHLTEMLPRVVVRSHSHPGDFLYGPCCSALSGA